MGERKKKKDDKRERKVAAEIPNISLDLSGNYEIDPSVVFVSGDVCLDIISVKLICKTLIV